MKRRASGNPVQIFSFLDVLMSAMGSLILLLVLIVHQTKTDRDHAEQSLAVEQFLERAQPLPERFVAPALPALPAKGEVVPRPKFAELPPAPSLPVDLLKQRERLKNQLAQLDVRPGAVADQAVRDLLGRIARLKEALRAIELERKLTDERVDRLEKLREQLLGEKRELADASKRTQSPYAIVPFVGAKGTKRRPIFIECERTKITFQPEGVALTPHELGVNGFADRALTDLVGVAVAKIGANSREGEPYPLLLIRPDGIQAFYLAQKAMKRAKIPFGYELIPASVPLVYPEADADLRQALLAARATHRPGPLESPGRGVYADKGGDGRGSEYDKRSRNPGGSPSVAAEATGTGSGDRAFALDDFDPPKSLPGPAGAGQGEATGENGGPTAAPGAGRVDAGPPAFPAGQPSVGSPFGSPESLTATGAVGAVGQFSDENADQRPRLASVLAGSKNTEPEPPDSQDQSSAPAGTMVRQAYKVSDEPSAAPLGGGGSDPATEPFVEPSAPRPERTRRPTNAEPDPFANYRQEPFLLEESEPGDTESYSFAGSVNLPSSQLRQRVYIDCQANQLILAPDLPPMAAGPNDLPRIANEIRRFVQIQSRTWGKLGRFQKWKPVLVFRIRPDGLETYYRARLALYRYPVAIETTLIDALPRFDLLDGSNP